MDNLIQKLIELVEKTSPELWRIATKQVYASIIADTILSVIMLLLMVGLMVLIKKLKKGYDGADTYSDEEFPYVIGLIVSGIALIILPIIVVANIYIIAMKLANPEFYAIEILLGLVK